MNINVNPILWQPHSLQEWIICVGVWATILAIVSLGWICIEEMSRSPEKKLRNEYSRIATFCCVYVAVWFVSACALGLAMECWPQFAAAVNHFFATGVRPF
jgi:hypothetical protein